MRRTIDAKELSNSEIETILTAMEIIYRQAKARGVKAKCVLIERTKARKCVTYDTHFIDMSMVDVKKAVKSKKIENAILY
jgi:hypothetical protein